MTSDELPAPDDEAPAPAIAPRRLHPAGIAVLGVGSLRELALPLGIAFFATVFGGGGGQPMLRAVIYAAAGAVNFHFARLVLSCATLSRW